LRGIVSDVLALRDLREVFLREPHLAYRVGALMGRELVALGFHLNFAPVCDVAIEQDGKDIIGDRAFSHEAHEVAMLAAKFIQGMQGSGLAGCAKHFPGHGATTTDSHFLLPIVSTSADILEERELAPFRSAIKAEVASIMTAHLIAQNLDEDKPATMSPKIINELLRVKLEFDGVVISDDLDMKAVADHYELKEILRASLESCVDMFIIGNNLEKTYEAIACLDELIKSHDYLAQKAMLAKQRVDKLRSRYVGKALAPDLRQAQHIVKSVPHLELLNSCR
jgi:beta-N-acetylhexosaminidase